MYIFVFIPVEEWATNGVAAIVAESEEQADQMYRARFKIVGGQYTIEQVDIAPGVALVAFGHDAVDLSIEKLKDGDK